MRRKSNNSKKFRDNQNGSLYSYNEKNSITKRFHEQARITRKRIRGSNSSSNGNHYDLNRQVQNRFVQKTIDQIIEVIPRRHPPNPNQTSATWNKSLPENKNLPFLHTMKRHVSWLTVQTQSQPEPMPLGREIVEFTKYIMLQEDEVSCRNEIIQDVKDVVSAKWPHPVTVQTFGSYHSGLSIFLSDIDMTIVGFNDIATDTRTASYNNDNSPLKVTASTPSPSHYTWFSSSTTLQPSDTFQNNNNTQAIEIDADNSDGGDIDNNEEIYGNKSTEANDDNNNNDDENESSNEIGWFLDSKGDSSCFEDDNKNMIVSSSPRDVYDIDHTNIKQNEVINNDIKKDTCSMSEENMKLISAIYEFDDLETKGEIDEINDTGSEDINKYIDKQEETEHNHMENSSLEMEKLTQKDNTSIESRNNQICGVDNSVPCTSRLNNENDHVVSASSNNISNNDNSNKISDYIINASYDNYFGAEHDIHSENSSYQKYENLNIHSKIETSEQNDKELLLSYLNNDNNANKSDSETKKCVYVTTKYGTLKVYNTSNSNTSNSNGNGVADTVNTQKNKYTGTDDISDTNEYTNKLKRVKFDESHNDTSYSNNNNNNNNNNDTNTNDINSNAANISQTIDLNTQTQTNQSFSHSSSILDDFHTQTPILYEDGDYIFHVSEPLPKTQTISSSTTSSSSSSSYPFVMSNENKIIKQTQYNSENSHNNDSDSDSDSDSDDSNNIVQGFSGFLTKFTNTYLPDATPNNKFTRNHSNDNSYSNLRKLEDPAVTELKNAQVKKLEQIHWHLKSMDYVREYELRRYARVPIINFTHRNGICCDISCGVLAQDTTDHVIKLQVKSGFAFFPLSCVLKIFLHQFRLDEPYLGGIGSFKLYVMVAHIIQKYKLYQQSIHSNHEQTRSRLPTLLKSNFTDDDCNTLSYLLLDFFHYYSQSSNFNIYTTIKVFDTEVDFEACRLVETCRIKFQTAYSVLYSKVYDNNNTRVRQSSNSHQISNSILSHIIFAESLQKQRNQALQSCQLHRPISLEEKNLIAQNILNEIISRHKHIILSDEFKSGVTLQALENVNPFASLKLKSYRTVESFFRKPSYTTGALAATSKSYNNNRLSAANTRSLGVNNDLTKSSSSPSNKTLFTPFVMASIDDVGDNDTEVDDPLNKLKKRRYEANDEDYIESTSESDIKTDSNCNADETILERRILRSDSKPSPIPTENAQYQIISRKYLINVLMQNIPPGCVNIPKRIGTIKSIKDKLYNFYLDLIRKGELSEVGVLYATFYQAVQLEKARKDKIACRKNKKVAMKLAKKEKNKVTHLAMKNIDNSILNDQYDTNHDSDIISSDNDNNDNNNNKNGKQFNVMNNIINNQNLTAETIEEKILRSDSKPSPITTRHEYQIVSRNDLINVVMQNIPPGCVNIQKSTETIKPIKDTIYNFYMDLIKKDELNEIDILHATFYKAVQLEKDRNDKIALRKIRKVAMKLAKKEKNKVTHLAMKNIDNSILNDQYDTNHDNNDNDNNENGKQFNVMNNIINNQNVTAETIEERRILRSDSKPPPITTRHEYQIISRNDLINIVMQNIPPDCVNIPKSIGTIKPIKDTIYNFYMDLIKKDELNEIDILHATFYKAVQLENARNDKIAMKAMKLKSINISNIVSKSINSPLFREIYYDNHNAIRINNDEYDDADSEIYNSIYNRNDNGNHIRNSTIPNVITSSSDYKKKIKKFDFKIKKRIEKHYNKLIRKYKSNPIEAMNQSYQIGIQINIHKLKKLSDRKQRKIIRIKIAKKVLNLNSNFLSIERDISFTNHSQSSIQPRVYTTIEKKRIEKSLDILFRNNRNETDTVIHSNILKKYGICIPDYVLAPNYTMTNKANFSIEVNNNNSYNNSRMNNTSSIATTTRIKDQKRIKQSLKLLRDPSTSAKVAKVHIAFIQNLHAVVPNDILEKFENINVQTTNSKSSTSNKDTITKNSVIPKATNKGKSNNILRLKSNSVRKYMRESQSLITDYYRPTVSTGKKQLFTSNPMYPIMNSLNDYIPPAPLPPSPPQLTLSPSFSSYLQQPLSSSSSSLLSSSNCITSSSLYPYYDAIQPPPPPPPSFLFSSLSRIKYAYPHMGIGSNSQPQQQQQQQLPSGDYT